MKTIINQALTKQRGSLFYADIEDKRVYYKEIAHPVDFARLYKQERPMCEFKSPLRMGTGRPFITYPAESRKSEGIKETDVLLVRICRENQEVEFVTKMYKWRKLHIPQIIVDKLNIQNNENIFVKIIARDKCLPESYQQIDLAQIVHYDKNVKIIPRAKNYITIYRKQKEPITIPRFIQLSSNLIELFFLVHGDGHYAYKLYFANKLPELHVFVIDEFEKIFRLPKAVWRSRILLHDLRHGLYAKEYWKNAVCLNEQQFYSNSKCILRTSPAGNLRIVMDKTIVSLIFRYVFEKIKNNMEKQNAFHALNGLLAAEGGAQIGKKGLHKITLSYNMQEKTLFEKILRQTGIVELCKDQQSKTFVIEGWTNLYSFFKTFLFNEVVPFRTHSVRRKRAFEGFLNHSFTKTMIKYLSVINKNHRITVKKLSMLLKIREDSILDTLRKKQYKTYIKIEGLGINRNPFLISISKEGKDFLKLITNLEKF
ncbi:hypothetical protein CMO88_04985 [Candidatus Woesearchaeota archaeon]|nr:hypothetical protein [Candidatus Woesearchaeota archaeon]|tara:strand:- start:1596 stop:3044 length:1449 start_codon:yes stop_codon:yes gene_type:complete